MRTYYEVLRLSETCSQEDIVRAYRKLAMRWHPDRNPGNENEATTRFKELGLAREVLEDSARRADYDQSLASFRQAQQSQQDSEKQLERWARLAKDVAMQGHNKDVVFGALIAHGCPYEMALEIATQVVSAQSQSPGKSPKEPTPQPPRPERSERSPEGVFMWLLILGVGALIAFNLPEQVPVAVTAPAAAPTPAATATQTPFIARTTTLDELLPSEVVKFDTAHSVGTIFYKALPDRPEFDSFRSDLGEPFSLKLLQVLNLDKTRRLLLFSSAPPDFGCHACSPILSAMVVRQVSETRMEVVVPLHVVTTAGRWGKLSLEGELAASALRVGPGREGFVFKERDMGQGNTEEWGRLFALTDEAVVHLGGFEVHSDSFGSGHCIDKPRETCEQSDTKIRFSKQPGPNGYFDIHATTVGIEVEGDLPRKVQTQYTMSFDGTKYMVAPSSQGAASAATVPTSASSDTSR
jgi:hypothetical protein